MAVMMARIAAALVTLGVNAAAGVVVFFFMLLAMNGFSESDATWGLGAYVVAAVAVTLGMAVSAWLFVAYLARRRWNEWGSAAMAASAFSIVGAGLKAVCGIIGVLVAEAARTHFR